MRIRLTLMAVPAVAWIVFGQTTNLGKQTWVSHPSGKTVVPGLIETHVHAFGISRQGADQPDAELSSIAEIQTCIEAGIFTAINGNPAIRLEAASAMKFIPFFPTMYIAVSRKNQNGITYNAEQPISRIAARRAMISDAA